MNDNSAACILVIEDDPTIRDLLTDALSSEGYIVLGSPTAEAAWPMMRRRVPELIMLDLMLPDMDGIEVCRRLRAEPMLADVPVLMLTARAELEDRLSGLAAGADDYLVKPFNMRELRARVAMHLRRSERERNLNPLTHLPGNPAIERAIALQLARHRQFSVCYVDIDSFKPYNDRYGFAAGDRVIHALATILRRVIMTGDDPANMVGHIGGDDFLALIGSGRGPEVGDAITEAFDSTIPTFYTKEDFQAGYTLVKNRRGNIEQFPLISVSVAVVPAVVSDNPAENSTIAQLARNAAEIKSFLKRKPGSGYLIDRRGGN